MIEPTNSIPLTTDEKLMFVNSTELFSFSVDQIVYMSAEGNYSHIITPGGGDFLVAFQLGQIEQLIAQQLPTMSECFIRVGRNYIINQHYICSINVPRQRLVLIDRTYQRYALNPARDALKALKSYLEVTYGKSE